MYMCTNTIHVFHWVRSTSTSNLLVLRWKNKYQFIKAKFDLLQMMNDQFKLTVFITEVNSWHHGLCS